MGVIRVAVKMNIVFAKDVTKWEDVDDEEKWPQDRALWHTGRNRENVRFVGFELKELSATGKIGGEPGEGSVSNANG